MPSVFYDIERDHWFACPADKQIGPGIRENEVPLPIGVSRLLNHCNNCAFWVSEHTLRMIGGGKWDGDN